jgi:His/Glu/Gln/Arg/opine family amino acid ABC transporter permease subunit
MTLAVTYDLRSFLEENWEALLRGFERTLLVSAIAIAGSLVIGLALGAARAHRVPVVSQLGVVYVEIIRNTPILVQIFFLYFGLGQFPATRMDVFTVAWLSITIWGGAFQTENFRAGFEAVPFSLREGGLALGFTPFKNFLNVTLPVGGRIALPSTINTFIGTLKNTALLYVIAYEELTTTAFQIQALTLETLEAWTVLGIVYLTLVWGLSLSIRLLESHLALPGEA